MDIKLLFHLAWLVYILRAQYAGVNVCVCVCLLIQSNPYVWELWLFGHLNGTLCANTERDECIYTHTFIYMLLFIIAIYPYTTLFSDLFVVWLNQVTRCVARGG